MTDLPTLRDKARAFDYPVRNGFNWQRTKKQVCDCPDVDATEVTPMMTVPRGKPGQTRLRRAQMIRHRKGEAIFWHWSDVPKGRLRFQ